MPEATPGQGIVQLTNSSGKRLIVINVITNLFMAENASVFKSLDGALIRNRLIRDADFILVDAHGEATSEKMALGHMVDGRVSMLVGTHTHVPTADERILDNGTAYQTDVGMCGDYDSVIGMEKVTATERFTGRGSRRLSVSLGEVTLCGLLVEADINGLAKKVSPLRIGGKLSAAISSHN